MTDIDVLAEDYWTFYLDEQPTSAHLLGDYSRAGQFESATRESEDREIEALGELVRRAGALTDADLTEQQRLTRDVLVDDATSKIGMIEQRFAELAADPIFGI